MFEKIVLRHSKTGSALTLGEIAEALLFYQHVHLILDSGSLGELIRSLGTSELLALVERKRLTAVYAEDMLGAYTQTIQGIQQHSFAAFFISGNKLKGTVWRSRSERLANALKLAGHSGGEARRLTERFTKSIEITRYASNLFVEKGVHIAAVNSLDDAGYVAAAIRRMLRDQPGFEIFAEKVSVEVVKMSAEKFFLHTNINFAAGNDHRKQIDPTLEPLTQGHLVSALLDASADLSVASHYGGDFYTSLVNSDLVRLRCAELLKRSGISAAQMQQFKDVALPNYPTIREVINSGERSFAEFEKLLDQSAKFRESIHKMGPDASLVAEYLKEVSQEGWLSSLPGKGLRFVIGLIVGAITGDVAGATVGAADMFLLDKLKGWRPNHFVDGKLRPFLDT
jgi:hypothetical protein